MIGEMPRGRAMKNSKRILLIIMALLLAFCMSGCSDDGRVQYLDDTLLGELCGITQESTEASTEESTEASTEESAEASSEESTEESTEDSTEASSEESTGESFEESTEESADEDTLLIGSWQSETISVEDVCMEGLKAAGQYKSYLQIDNSKLVIRVNFAYFQDGRATLEIDLKSYQELMDYLTAQVTSAVLQYYQKYLEDMGLYVSVEQYLRMLGIKPETYVATIMQDSTGDLNLSDYRRECKAALEGDRLYVAYDEARLESRQDYLLIELGDKTLRFLEYYENGKKKKEPLGLDVTLPISFTRMEE